MILIDDFTMSVRRFTARSLYVGKAIIEQRMKHFIGLRIKHFIGQIWCLIQVC